MAHSEQSHRQSAESPEEETAAGPVIRDRRRIDPVTGQVRHDESADASAATPASEAAGAPQQATGEPGPSARSGAALPEPGASSPGVGDARLPGSGESVTQAQVAELEATVAERTEDLQRLQAEYVNYRRRVDRDRQRAGDAAVASVLAELLGVLDDIELARQHGDLTGPFKTVAERLESALAKIGLVRYGEPGEEFDPTVHEALTHGHSSEVDRPTAVAVLQPGYRFATANLERILRPARVAVAEPAPEQPAQANGQAAAGTDTAGTDTAGTDTAGTDTAGGQSGAQASGS